MAYRNAFKLAGLLLECIPRSPLHNGAYVPEKDCSDDGVDGRCCREASFHAEMLRTKSNGEGSDASSEPAEGVHDANGDSSLLRLDNIIKRGPDVGLIDALGEAEADHGGDVLSV